MKKPLLILFLASSWLAATSQTSQELLQQKKTQKKYLLQQIAALQMYIGYVKKGYSIVHKGLSTISDIKNGELNLHAGYFNTLKKVNPQVAKYSKVPAIIALQIQIVKVCNSSSRQLIASEVFNDAERAYAGLVYERLLEDCSAIVDALIAVIANNNLEMKDDERLQRINELYKDMQDNYRFVRSFSNGTKILSKARKQEINDIENSRKINGIKK